MNKHLHFILWLAKKTKQRLKEGFRFVFIESWEVPPIAVILSMLLFIIPGVFFLDTPKHHDPVSNRIGLGFLIAWVLYILHGFYRAAFNAYCREQERMVEKLREE